MNLFIYHPFTNLSLQIRSSKGDASLRQSQPANKEPMKKDPQQNGLNKEQELTADELLANIQSAVDELLHQYHPENEPLANGSHELAPQPDKQTVKVSTVDILRKLFRFVNNNSLPASLNRFHRPKMAPQLLEECTHLLCLLVFQMMLLPFH